MRKTTDNPDSDAAVLAGHAAPAASPDPAIYAGSGEIPDLESFTDPADTMDAAALAMENITLAPFLTFGGEAEDAMTLYKSVFPDASWISLTRIEDPALGAVGKVLNGQLTIKGQLILFMDLPAEQAVPFSWATSLYVNCADEAEFDTIFDGLSKGGSVMMGPEPVMNLRKVAWVTDRFNVTWQLVWA